MSLRSRRPECVGLLPASCVICGSREVLLVDELARLEQWAAVTNGVALCARHWSNFAQAIALSHGLTLLREEERRFTLSD